MLGSLSLGGSLAATCLVAVVVGLLVNWMIQKWKYNYPPGPRALPLIGNLLQLKEDKVHEQAFEWSKKYGPVLTLKFGLMPNIFVNHIDPALEVLVKKSTEFGSKMLTPSMSAFTYGGKDIGFALYGPHWKWQKRVSIKALRYFMQGGALENRVSDAIQTGFEEIDKETGEFEPMVYINFIITNIAAGLCFGDKYTFEDKEIHSHLTKKFEKLVELLGPGVIEDFIPGLKYVYKSRALRRIEQLTDDIIEKYFRKKFQEAKRSFSRDNVRHLCDSLILAHLETIEADGQQELDSITEDHLIQTLTDIFLAGIYDTSKASLDFAILHMIAFPDIQDKVQEEIDHVVGKDRLPSLADRSQLSYTEAVLHESMRYATAFPIGGPHMTTCDTEVAGYKIPKGTLVTVNHWALHHDPEAWEDVDRFIPERFLDDNGKLGPTPKNWLPFSAGKRVCAGEFVAKPMLHLMFACLMQRYKWKMMSGKCPDITPACNVLELLSKPYKAIIERRI